MIFVELLTPEAYTTSKQTENLFTAKSISVDMNGMISK